MQRWKMKARRQSTEEGRGRRVFLGLAPEFGQAVVSVQLAAGAVVGPASFAAAAERARATGPARGRPGQHLLEAAPGGSRGRGGGRGYDRCPGRLDRAAPERRARAAHRAGTRNLELGRGKQRRRELSRQVG